MNAIIDADSLTAPPFHDTKVGFVLDGKTYFTQI